MIILKCKAELLHADNPKGTILGCGAGKGKCRQVECPKKDNRYCFEISCLSEV